MNQLYPEIEPYRTGWIKVSDIHELYYEECGNPQGEPVVFLHGGPGAGITPLARRFFNPKKYRIILFDQRGAGKSRPNAELVDNTTWDLVSDIEKIRELMAIERWLVFGGSWGSTLALAYSTTHPDRVSGLILRGIFMCRQEEIQWFYQHGAHFIFPDAWKAYVEPIPPAERHDLVAAFYRQLTSSDVSIQKKAALAWSVWEGSTIKLIPDKKSSDHFANIALAIARIECHYFVNRCWFRCDDQLLQDAHKIRHIPTTIVHGRYDVVCTVKNAFDLKEVLPEAKLVIVADAGHAGDEVGIISALVEATDSFRCAAV